MSFQKHKVQECWGLELELALRCIVKTRSGCRENYVVKLVSNSQQIQQLGGKFYWITVKKVKIYHWLKLFTL